uniref:Putative transcription factor n=1 Tax=Ixodes ricinus TaxID=34613 RepID=A0A0K8R3D9_IXORI
MLLLKLTLVILILEIGERTMCSKSGSTSSAQENEDVSNPLPPGTYINVPDEKGCSYKQILDYSEGEALMGNYLVLTCTKSCPPGQKRNVVDGNKCTATLKLLTNGTVDVTVGSCAGGSCIPDSPPHSRIITLLEEGAEEEEEEEAEGEEKAEGEDEEEEE